MNLKNFRTLDLARRFYRECKKLTLTGAPRQQLQRASLSVGLNLAEARGRHTHKDQLKFFHIAFGSLRESQALLSLEDQESTTAFKLADELGAALYSLIKNAK